MEQEDIDLLSSLDGPNGGETADGDIGITTTPASTPIMVESNAVQEDIGFQITGIRNHDHAHKDQRCNCGLWISTRFAYILLSFKFHGLKVHVFETLGLEFYKDGDYKSVLSLKHIWNLQHRTTDNSILIQFLGFPMVSKKLEGGKCYVRTTASTLIRSPAHSSALLLHCPPTKMMSVLIFLLKESFQALSLLKDNFQGIEVRGEQLTKNDVVRDLGSDIQFIIHPTPGCSVSFDVLFKVNQLIQKSRSPWPKLLNDNNF